jgi:outer membrane protein OmpA-like peptidoglycan-associated protein
MKRALPIAFMMWPTLCFGWPMATDWVPLRAGGIPFEDAADDAVGTSDLALEITSNSAVPAFQWYADSSDVYFRLTLADDPMSNGMFKAMTWAVLFETDGDPSNFEYVVASSGVSAQLEAYANNGAVGVEPDFTDYTYVAFLDQTDAVRRDEDGAVFFVDLRISRAELSTYLGLGDTDSLQLAAVSGSSVYASRADVAGCDGDVFDCTDLANVLSDVITIDLDGDNLTDPQEEHLGSDPSDADTDDDGVLDGDEGTGDADGDSIIDVLDCDSDADGLKDGTEAGIAITGLHADTDVAAGCFVADSDTSAAPTNPYDWDTDGGDLPDGIEDWNYNGKIDPPWETDPNDPADDLDSDGDQIADVLELLGDDGEVNDSDSDGDGITDADEWLYDSDGDGLPNFLDTDSDDDGIDDATEGSTDSDKDGTPDYLDSDSDDDGIADRDETDADTDGDGTPNYLDEDSDGDEIADTDEGTVDSDGDGTADFMDEDSDGDGIDDLVEGMNDADGDGIPNYLDDDSDGDGLPDELETDDDADHDDVPNFVDLDSDNDGTPDASEGSGDDDCDTVPNFIDADHDDGFCDTGIDEPDVGPYSPTDPDGDLGAFGKGSFTGGACSVVPLGISWLPSLFVGGLALARRRRREEEPVSERSRVLAYGPAVGGLVSLLALGASGDANAADGLGLNAQRFAPSVDGGVFVGLEDTWTPPAWTAGAGLWMNHADDPFVFRSENPDVDELAILGSVTTASLVGYYSFGILRVGMELPVHLHTDSYGFDGGMRTGDSRISLKSTFFESTAGELEWALGAALDTSFPTGNSQAWVGAGNYGLSGAALASLRWRGLVAVANIGASAGTGGTVSDLDLTSGFDFGAGVAYALNEGVSLAAEVDGRQWFAGGGQPGSTPLEWLGSVRMQPVPDWTATFGGGTGLSKGVGAPDFRVVGAMTWTPSKKEMPESIVDVVTEEPPAPEAPALGGVVVRAISPAGIPVRGAEVRILGTVGVPLKTGNDGILEARIAPGKYEVSVAAVGWGAKTDKLVVKEDATANLVIVLRPEAVMIDEDSGQIFLHRKVFFEVDKAELKVGSLPILDDLVQTLVEHPEIQKLRIEGHTDTTGTDTHNLTLSNQRAEAVRAYLIRSGVEGDRLVAKGYGEGRTLQDGESDAVHATNRRVEFHMLERAATE